MINHNLYFLLCSYILQESSWMTHLNLLDGPFLFEIFLVLGYGIHICTTALLMRVFCGRWLITIHREWMVSSHNICYFSCFLHIYNKENPRRKLQENKAIINVLLHMNHNYDSISWTVVYRKCKENQQLYVIS